MQQLGNVAEVKEVKEVKGQMQRVICSYFFPQESIYGRKERRMQN